MCVCVCVCVCVVVVVVVVVVLVLGQTQCGSVLLDRQHVLVSCIEQTKLSS